MSGYSDETLSLVFDILHQTFADSVSPHFQAPQSMSYLQKLSVFGKVIKYMYGLWGLIRNRLDKALIRECTIIKL